MTNAEYGNNHEQSFEHEGNDIEHALSCLRKLGSTGVRLLGISATFNHLDTVLTTAKLEFSGNHALKPNHDQQVTPLELGAAFLAPHTYRPGQHAVSPGSPQDHHVNAILLREVPGLDPRHLYGQPDRSPRLGA